MVVDLRRKGNANFSICQIFLAIFLRFADTKKFYTFAVEMAEVFDKEKLICTHEYTTEWMGKIKDCRVWIKAML
ncbi:hypothetical protein AGMMS4957_00710 [Bacteroidia bacterium]|nr:hypothetical protein AGMMS4957_00710 [Bacteroidia bacterium]